MITCISVVVQFYPRFKFSFLLFLGMVMYDNNMIMSLKQKKRKFEPRIKLNHNISTRLPPLLLLGLRHAKKLSFSEALFKCFSVAEPMLLAFCTGYIMKRSVRK